MTKFELKLIAATLAFIPASIAIVQAYDAYWRAHPGSLMDATWRGQFLSLKLNPSACEEFDFGEMICGRRYTVRYRTSRGAKWWAVNGPSKTSVKDTTAAFPTEQPQPGTFSIFGATFNFDNTGKLTVQGKEVGTVKFATAD